MVSPREFIRVWQGANSLAEVAAKVGRSKNTCRVRAIRYRQNGIPLKDFPIIEVEATDWDGLAEYAKSLLSGKETADGGDGRKQEAVAG